MTGAIGLFQAIVGETGPFRRVQVRECLDSGMCLRWSVAPFSVQRVSARHPLPRKDTAVSYSTLPVWLLATPWLQALLPCQPLLEPLLPSTTDTSATLRLGRSSLKIVPTAWLR